MKALGGRPCYRKKHKAEGSARVIKQPTVAVRFRPPNKEVIMQKEETAGFLPLPEATGWRRG